MGTPLFFLAILFVVLGVVLYFISIYNGLIKVSRNIDKAWANIDVILKQRHDEIPKLIKICEGYMKYERETLEKLTAARTACINGKGASDSADKEEELSGLLRNLFAVAENYPDLKTNTNFLQMQNRVSHLEGQIADRREFYNDSVNNYNIRIHQIPDMLVAGSLRMCEKEMFKVSEGNKKAPDIEFKFPA